MTGDIEFYLFTGVFVFIVALAAIEQRNKNRKKLNNDSGDTGVSGSSDSWGDSDGGGDGGGGD